MKKVKLTPQELEWKRSRDQLVYITNKIKGAFSFGHIKTFKDILHNYGMSSSDITNAGYFDSELNNPVTFQDVKDWLSDRHIELETSIWLQKNPPDLTPEEIKLEVDNSPIEVSICDSVDRIPPGLESIVDIEKDIEKDEYALPLCKKDKAFLYWYQKKAAHKILGNIARGDRAVGLIAPTGSGKTYIAGAILARWVESGFHKNKTMTLWPYIYVTRASIVEQTKRVLTKVFSLNCDENSPRYEVLVINIEQLRSKFGTRFVKEEIIVENGESTCKWTWRDNLFPIAIIWDEAHALKREYSEQSRIAQAYNEIESNDTFQLFMSATLASRVSDCKCLAVATRVPYTFGLQKNAPLTNAHWKDFAKNIASDYGRLEIEPLQYSPSAIDRLMDYIDRYMVRVKGIKPQFKAHNRIVLINFTTREGREYYETALERYLKQKAKAECDEGMSAQERNVCMLVAVKMFQIASESNPDRIRFIGDRMVHSVKEGRAAGSAFNHKISIAKLVVYLNEVHGIPRDKISLIWGGKPTVNKKAKTKFDLVHNEDVMAEFRRRGISLKDLNLDDIEEATDEDYPEHLKLGPQNYKERQQEIDRFQRQDTDFCIYSAKAGGVGLSLHHTDELTEFKVRHKPSGYAYEEDIPLVPTKPRDNHVAPPWSDVELVQMLGRFPRINSLSDTPQYLVGIRGTIDMRIMARVSMKLACLSKVVRQREDWTDIITKEYRDEEVDEAKLLGDYEDAEGALTNEQYENDEEEE